MRGTVTGRPVGVSKPEVAKAVSVQIGSIEQAAAGFSGEQRKSFGLLHGDRGGCDP